MRCFRYLVVVLVCVLIPRVAILAAEDAHLIQAGAAVIDITPRKLPVLQSGGFLSKTATEVAAPIYARCLVLKSMDETIAIVIVDSCMIPREVCDLIKEEAAASARIRADRILIAATHTHSAPSAMDYCLGTMQDRNYTVQMIPQVASAIHQAIANLEPANVGSTVINAWEHTNSRRWIKRSDKISRDPFGDSTVRAMMHPNPLDDYVGPSGPEDPALTILSVVRADRSPIAILANFSMHYHGMGANIHPDYFGIYAKELEKEFAAKHGEKSFVGMMSQGTSGDLHLRTYDPDRKDEPKPDIHLYAKALVELTLKANATIQHVSSVPLVMAQEELELERRLPGPERMAWANEFNEKRGDRTPATQPEVYAMQAQWIHDNPKSKLILQTVRIGDLGITAMPNEVYGITGLKLKAQSPLPLTMNIELANGADGYIPPPEQHVLGGYTTWPSRTAGLEVQAEPKIVASVLSLLEGVAGRSRKPILETHAVAAQAALSEDPIAYWRMNEISPNVASDASEYRNDARYEDGVAYYLPGVSANPTLDMASATPEQPNPFSGTQINRSVHFAGGRLYANLKALTNEYSVSLWLWNGFPIDARAITGYLFSRGRGKDQLGEHLGISGNNKGMNGRLLFFNGRQAAFGETKLEMRRWHHVVLTREGNAVNVYLDGRTEPEIKTTIDWTLLAGIDDVFVGGRSDGMFGFEGKIDEVSIFNRALDPSEIRQLYAASGRPVSIGSATISEAKQPDVSSQPAYTPEESLKHFHVPEGFVAEIVAAEPQTIDPVAFDWDARGRLWVVEMSDYPLGMDNNGKPGGRVRVLEDVDRDGRYEKATLFADELSFPNGILTWRDGAIVTAAPEILFLQDKDGDGKADHREVLVSGLNQGNQQLRPNGLRWGLDNWVYVASGSPGAHYTGQAPLQSMRNGVTLEIGNSDFRFRPDTGELEREVGPSQFGRSRDDWGHWFGTQNAKPLWHYVFSERYLKRNAYLATGETTKQLLKLPAPVRPAHLPEKRFHNLGQAGHYTSACAGVIHRDARLFGPGMFGFVCEPFHNLAQQIEITESGVSFVGKALSYEKRDFIASTDRWCRPVMIRTGPDGGLWVADMYRFMIEHPQFLPPEGKEVMLPRYRLGDDKGRIYRISKADDSVTRIADLSNLTTLEYIALLSSENGFVRDKSHQILLWNNDPEAIMPLKLLAKDVQHPLASLHALCILDGIQKTEVDDLMPALQADHAGLLENALRLSEPFLRSNESKAMLNAIVGAFEHPSPKVQLQLALTLGESSERTAGQTLGWMMRRDHSDPYRLTAILTSATPHLQALVEATHGTSNDIRANVLKPLLQLALGRGDRAMVASLLGLVEGAPGEKSAVDGLQTVLDALQSANQDLESLAQENSHDALAIEVKRIEQLLLASLHFAKQDKEPFERRLPTALMLSRSKLHQSTSFEIVSSWLNITQPLEIQLTVVKALAQSGVDKVPDTFIAFWPQSGPSVRNAMLEAWMTREAWCYDLLSRIRKKQIAMAALDASHRSRLTNHQVARVSNQAKQLFGQASSSRAEIIAKYKPALTMDADAKRGHLVYQKVCSACHRIGNEGVAIGPDMSAFVLHEPEKLLANILDPNIDIQPGFQAFACLLNSGEQLFGIVTQETSASITIKGKEGLERVILRSEIELLKATNVSYMPEGLESNIDLQQMADLIAFLKTPRE